MSLTKPSLNLKRGDPVLVKGIFQGSMNRDVSYVKQYAGGNVAARNEDIIPVMSEENEAASFAETRLRAGKVAKSLREQCEVIRNAVRTVGGDVATIEEKTEHLLVLADELDALA